MADYGTIDPTEPGAARNLELARLHGTVVLEGEYATLKFDRDEFLDRVEDYIEQDLRTKEEAQLSAVSDRVYNAFFESVEVRQVKAGPGENLTGEDAVRLSYFNDERIWQEVVLDLSTAGDRIAAEELLKYTSETEIVDGTSALVTVDVDPETYTFTYRPQLLETPDTEAEPTELESGVLLPETGEEDNLEFNLHGDRLEREENELFDDGHTGGMDWESESPEPSTGLGRIGNPGT